MASGSTLGVNWILKTPQLTKSVGKGYYQNGPDIGFGMLKRIVIPFDPLVNPFPASLVTTINGSQTNQVALMLYYPFNSDVTENSNGYGNGVIDIVGTDCQISNTIYKVGSGSLYNNGSTTSYLPFPTIMNTNGYTFSLWIYLIDKSSAKIFSFNGNSPTQFIRMSFDGSWVFITTSTSNRVFQPNINTWYHIAWTLDTNGNSIVYVNGVSTFTTSTNTPYINGELNGFLLGNGIGGNSINGYVDDFYYFDGIVTNSNIQSIYNLGSSVVSTGLLTAIPTGCVGLYTCKWINNNYTGPIIQLMSSGTASPNPCDFYIDSSGTTITTGANGTGTTLTSWLGANTAYVSTWYDQSTVGNNATQTDTTKQPTFDLVNKCINFAVPSNSFFNLNNNTVPSGDSAYTVLMKHGQFNLASYPAATYLSSGNYLLGNPTEQANNFRLAVSGSINNPQYVNYWYYAGSPNPVSAYSANTNTLGMCYSQNVITNVYDPISHTINTFVNGIQTASLSNLPVRTSSVNYNYIGGVPSGVPNFFNAQMYHLSIFNTSLSTQNRSIMESFNISSL